MDRLVEFLDVVQRANVAAGKFRGLLHILIGRHITAADGGVISAGLTWRQVSALLRQVRWDKDAVLELGLQSRDLPPRDRERYWYNAISHAQLDSDEARNSGDALAKLIEPLGYKIS
ncbi:MAG: hypothetical protein ACJ8C4_19195 [Gemmataceae bacterium]